MDRKTRFGIEYSQRAPKSVCQCGHSGDGAHSEHASVGFAAGHGPCTAKGCRCEQFSWARWVEVFEAALRKAVRS